MWATLRSREALIHHGYVKLLGRRGFQIPFRMGPIQNLKRKGEEKEQTFFKRTGNPSSSRGVV